VQADSVELIVTVPRAVADPGAGERARVLLVLDAVRTERITWRAAARALGLAPSAFLDLARAHGVPVTRIAAEDIAADLAALDRIVPPRASGG